MLGMDDATQESAPATFDEAMEDSEFARDCQEWYHENDARWDLEMGKF